MTYATKDVIESHDHFRAAMMALSHPGRRIPIEKASGDAQDRTGERILGALCEDGAPVTRVAADETMTGARPEETGVLLVHGSNSHGLLNRLPRGTEEYPERGATAIYLVAGLADSSHLCLTGPGVDGELEIRLPIDLAEVIARNAACGAYPTGVDLLVTGDGWVTGLPRTTKVREVER